MTETLPTFEANPAEPTSIPWWPDCDGCRQLGSDQQPGLSTWITAVARHIEDVHRIVLVTPKGTARA